MPTTPPTLPQALETGAHVRVVAPAGPVPDSALQAGLGILRERFGFEVSVDDNVSARQGYLAGSDRERAEALNRALRDPMVDAVWCARGGYGSTRIAPLVDTPALLNHPRPVIGFSDITALHGLLTRAGCVGFHGPVVTQLAQLDEESLERSQRLLRGDAEAGMYNLNGLRTRREGQATGPLLGGNLALLAALAGTPWQQDFTGAIVVVEDVGEPAYRIDRMLRQLEQACNLDQAAGVIAGSFSAVPDGSEALLDALFDELAQGGNGPVVSGFPCGHTARNWMLPLGVTAELNTATETLSLCAPWVVTNG